MSFSHLLHIEVSLAAPNMGQFSSAPHMHPTSMAMHPSPSPHMSAGPMPPHPAHQPGHPGAHPQFSGGHPPGMMHPSGMYGSPPGGPYGHMPSPHDVPPSPGKIM